MAGDELVGRGAVAMLAPALGEHEFLLRLQHRKSANFVEIPAETGFTGEEGQCRGLVHGIVSW